MIFVSLLECIAWHGMALRRLGHFGRFLPQHPDASISLVSAVLVMSLFGIMKTGIVFVVALILDGKYTVLNQFIPQSKFPNRLFYPALSVEEFLIISNSVTSRQKGPPMNYESSPQTESAHAHRQLLLFTSDTTRRCKSVMPLASRPAHCGARNGRHQH
jgi:hypothetical protein